MRASLAVVVPNFNGAAILPRCLAALAAQTVPPTTVVVVDNGSRDGSADQAERDFPGVDVVRLGRNTGFGAAANAGAATVVTDLVAILNSDARPSPTWVSTVTDFAAVAPYGGWSWGCPLTTPGGLVESAGDCYSPAGFAYKHAQGEPVESLPDVPYEVFAPPGAAPVFRRDVYEELGGYDARYFLYLEDIDLAFRARSRGYSSWLLPGAVVEHDLAASSRPAVATRHIARNGIWCQLVHAPRLNPRLVLRTTRRQLADARRRGVARAYAAGRFAALPAVPRLLVQRRHERAARVVSDDDLLRACGLPGLSSPLR